MSEKEIDWNQFLTNHKEAISAIIKSISISMSEAPKLKFRSTISVFLLLVSIISILAALCYVGKVSGEALTFLMGTIVGYLFIFLQKYVVGIR